MCPLGTGDPAMSISQLTHRKRDKERHEQHEPRVPVAQLHLVCTTPVQRMVALQEQCCG